MEGTSLRGWPGLYAQLEVSGLRHISSADANHNIGALAHVRDYYLEMKIGILSLHSQPQVDPIYCRENVS